MMTFGSEKTARYVRRVSRRKTVSQPRKRKMEAERAAMERTGAEDERLGRLGRGVVREVLRQTEDSNSAEGKLAKGVGLIRSGTTVDEWRTGSPHRAVRGHLLGSLFRR